MGSITEDNTSLPGRAKDGVKFGKELREKEFMFEKGYLNLNHGNAVSFANDTLSVLDATLHVISHNITGFRFTQNAQIVQHSLSDHSPGSFGTYPRPLRETLRAFQDAAEARPDDFIRYKYPSYLNESRKAMTNLINAPPKTVVFVPNATTGVNTILRSLQFEEGDHILYFSNIYKACHTTIEYITETTPAKAVKVEYTYPVEDDWLVDAFKQKIQDVKDAGGKVKIAVFDTVVSMPGVRVPFERLTQACRETGVLSLVDGAHAVGHLELDVQKFDPDFFVSNCHK